VPQDFCALQEADASQELRQVNSSLLLQVLKSPPWVCACWLQVLREVDVRDNLLKGTAAEQGATLVVDALQVRLSMLQCACVCSFGNKGL